MLIFAAIFIALALIFYTVGVWSEKRQGCLKFWHLVIFWIGLVLDTTGTTLMSKIAGGTYKLNVHGITGLVAIVVMLIHVLWATIVLLRNDTEMKAKFHRLSVFVWFVWLIPILVGMIYGVGR